MIASPSPVRLVPWLVAGLLLAQAALAQERRLTFGCDSSYPPYEYLDAEGQPAGFNVDVLHALAEETGFPIEVRCDEFWKVRRDFEAGRLDALAGWGFTEERAERYLFAVPHAIFTWSFFVRASGPVVDSEAALAGRTVLAQKGDLVVDQLAGRGNRVVQALSPGEVLRALAAGTGDCAVLNTGVGLHTLGRSGLGGIRRAGAPFHPVRYCIVLHRGDEERLARIDEALFVLKESGRYKQIYEKHLGAIDQAEPSFRAVLRRALVVLVPVLALLAAALAWSWSLRRLVKRRTAALEAELAERRKAEAALRLTRFTIDRSADSVLWVRDDGSISDVNEAACRNLLYSREELLALRVADVDQVLDPEAWPRRWEELRTAGSSTFGSRHLRKDGTELEVEVSASLVRYDGHEVVCAIVRDVTERRAAEEQIRKLNAELEERVRQRTAQLEASNRELEAFSYSVSHDLRTPVRAIEGFAALAAEEVGDRVGPEPQRLLGLVRSSALRMSRLIDDLLAFSRTGRTGLVPSRLPMREMARAAFAEVAAGPGGRPRAELRLGDLPEAHGDAALVRQVWLNLLSNAVKFSAGRERPLVEIDGELQGDVAVYRVTDNGAGFDMAHAGKLFGVFQRLHGANEFEGTGVGLALVQRIVKRHGGRVRAEGEVGRGATFRFELPAGRAASSEGGEAVTAPSARSSR